MDIVETTIELFDVLGNREEVGVNLWCVVVVSHVGVIVDLRLVKERGEGILLGDFWAVPGRRVRCP